MHSFTYVSKDTYVSKFRIAVILSKKKKKKKMEPNSFMHMFNLSTLYSQSIKLLNQEGKNVLVLMIAVILSKRIGVNRPTKALSMHIQKPY